MASNKNIEILLVEDNPDDAELTLRALKKNHLANSILHLENGVEALEFIFSQEGINTPKLILLDLKMPKIGGIEVLEKLKSDERTKRIPIVVLTSSKEELDIKECYRLGVNSYIVKPVEFDKFIKAVSTVGLYWMLINQPPYF